MKEQFPSSYENLIYTRTYSKWNDELMRREYWPETVKRYENFFIERVPKNRRKEFKDICNSIVNFEVMPSMRSLWTAGKALDRDNIGGYNCAFLSIDCVKSFSELLYILMNGTGCGFSVERQFINKLPEIPEQLEESDEVVVFNDSKLGWAQGFDVFIRGLFNGKIHKYDLSKIRPKGARLKTFGGRASGPDVLEDLIQFTQKMIERNAGKKLSSINCHDICCKIAEVVVVGGVRRSACISLSNLSDPRMSKAKLGQFWDENGQRSMANNSVAYTEKPDHVSFIEEWLNLIKSQSGERGIFNREGAKKFIEQTGRRSIDFDFGLNPCFTGDMKLLTENGFETFQNLNNTTPIIINKNGEKTKSKVWCSGKKETIELTLTNRNKITCTPDHIFMVNDGTEHEAKNLKNKRLMPFIQQKMDIDKESFTAGFILGDGNLTDLLNKEKKGLAINIGKNDKDVAGFIGIDYKDNKRVYYDRRFSETAIKFNLPKKQTYERFIPIDKLPFDSDIESFLNGLYSANGSVINTKSAFRVTYKTTSYKMAETLSEVLANSFFIKSYITTNKTKKVKFSNGEYNCKESYDVNIGAWVEIKKFCKYIGFVQKYKTEKLLNGLKRKSPMIRSIKNNGIKTVYDFTEPNTNWGIVNGFVVHNCGEVVLRPSEFCNLTEVVVRPTDTKKDICNKIQKATVLGCLQSTLTKFKFLRRTWKKNTEEERLLGVSLTGLRDHPILGTVCKDTKIWLTEMKQTAIDTAHEWSGILEINVPVAITLTKPSGTVSQLVDCSSGIHTRFSQYYIRRIRIARTDPLCSMLIAQDYPHNPEVGQDYDTANTFVFDFYRKSPETSVMNDDVTAIQQLEYWLMIKKYWCEHNPSSTIFVKDHEWIEVGAWIWKNWDYVTGLSFLPSTDSIYKLAPYEEISEEDYYEKIKQYPEIDFTQLGLYEYEDKTEGAREFACHGNACEI